MEEPLKIVLRLKERPVLVTDKDGVEKKYFLREMSGLDREEYMSFYSEKVIWNEDGEVAGYKDFKGMQSNLICRCLYDDNDKQVNEDTVKSFPSTALEALFAAAQKLNGLEAPPKDEKGKKKAEEELEAKKA